MENNLTDAFRLDTVALFPKGYFLENLAVRADGSILVSALNTGELWYVPAPDGKFPVEPLLIDRIDGLPRRSSRSNLTSSTFRRSPRPPCIGSTCAAGRLGRLRGERKC